MQKREVQLTLEGGTFTGILSNTSITEEKTKDDHQSKSFLSCIILPLIYAAVVKKNINFF